MLFGYKDDEIIKGSRLEALWERRRHSQYQSRNELTGESNGRLEPSRWKSEI